MEKIIQSPFLHGSLVGILASIYISKLPAKMKEKLDRLEKKKLENKEKEKKDTVISKESAKEKKDTEISKESAPKKTSSPLDLVTKPLFEFLYRWGAVRESIDRSKQLFNKEPEQKKLKKKRKKNKQNSEVGNTRCTSGTSF